MLSGTPSLEPAWHIDGQILVFPLKALGASYQMLPASALERLELIVQVARAARETSVVRAARHHFRRTGVGQRPVQLGSVPR